MNEAYRSIPKVDAVLKEPAMKELPYDEEVVKRLLRERLDLIRASIAGGRIARSPDAAELAREVASEVRDVMESGLVKVINAAGVVVFTNLGRAPLAQEAIKAATDAAQSYTDLEYNLSEGRRGSRQDHIRPITRACFGAEDALVVNNNAAAVMLVLASLARGREVIVSRGELVEIGGSFRMPDVMALSGAIMREVGTTNKTKIADYRDAISSATGLIMKVHRSNFSVVGFTEEAEIEELAALAGNSASRSSWIWAQACPLTSPTTVYRGSGPCPRVCSKALTFCASAGTRCLADPRPASSWAGRTSSLQWPGTRCTGPCAWTSSLLPPWGRP